LMDADGSGNLLYLPLDQLLNRSGIQMPAVDPTRNADSLTLQTTPQDAQQSLRDPRERRTRE